MPELKDSATLAWSESGGDLEGTVQGDVSVDSVTVANGGTVGSTTTPGAITIAGDGDTTFAGDVNISGATAVLVLDDTDATGNHRIRSINETLAIEADIANGGAGSDIEFYVDGALATTVESNGDLTVTGDLDVSNVTVDDGGTIGSATTPDAITVASDGDATFGSGDIKVEAASSPTIRISDTEQPQEWRFLNVNGSLFVRDETGSISRFTFEKVGNFKIQNGNLVIGTSGKGIDFSATSDASGSTSELLDDYEEGTWTPDYAGSSGGTSGSGSKFGHYTKIGNTVFARFQIALAKNTLSGNITITGLPFTSRDVSGNYGSGVSSVYRWNSDMPNLRIEVVKNTATAALFDNATNADPRTEVTDADMIDTAFRNVLAGVLVYSV